MAVGGEDRGGRCAGPPLSSIDDPECEICEEFEDLEPEFHSAFGEPEASASMGDEVRESLVTGGMDPCVFVPATKFLGARIGAAFKTGDRGLGYYPDVRMAHGCDEASRSRAEDTRRGQPVVIAIDEFQQILEYPEQNVEALLRTAIAPLKQTSFIFCGSNQAMMQTILLPRARPFVLLLGFQATCLMKIQSI